MPAKFQLKKGSTGKFRFTLLSTNGQVVATSQAYERKATAIAGIRSVQKIAGRAEIEDTTTKQSADVDAAAKTTKTTKTAKKAAKKAPAKVASAKKVVTKAARAAKPKAPAAAKGTPRKSVAATATRPVRKTPPPLTTAPKNLTPKL